MSTPAAGHIFILTRYSVFNQGLAGVRIANEAETAQDYRDKLFAPARLEARLQVFQAVTAASLVAQAPSACQVHLVVFIADILPPEHRARLEAVLAQIEAGRGVRTQLQTIASGFRCEPAHASLAEAADAFVASTLAGQDTAFATVRLADDDALASSFCADLSRFVRPEMAGIVVSFPYGVEAAFDAVTGTCHDVRRMYSPTVALGLTLVNRHGPDGRFSDARVHVYRLGNHLTVARKNPVLLNAERVAYLRIVTEHNDSNASARHGIRPLAFAHEVAGFPSIRFQPFPDTPAAGQDFSLTAALSSTCRLQSENGKLKGLARRLKEQRGAYKKKAVAAESRLAAFGGGAALKEVARLQRVLARQDAQLARRGLALERAQAATRAAEARAERTTQTLSYQLGHLLLHGTRSVGALLRLPARLLALRREARRRSATP